MGLTRIRRHARRTDLSNHQPGAACATNDLRSSTQSLPKRRKLAALVEGFHRHPSRDSQAHISRGQVRARVPRVLGNVPGHRADTARHDRPAPATVGYAALMLWEVRCEAC